MGCPQQEARQVLEVTVAQQHALSDGFSSLTQQRRQMRANPHHLEQLGHGQQQGNVELIPPGEDRSDRSDIIYLTGNSGGPPGPKSGQELDATLDGLGLLEPFGIRRYYTDYWGAYRRHLDANRYEFGLLI